MKNIKKTLLLHSCCGPCSSAVIERLAGDFDITVFYYNPCITDKDEYEKRKMAQISFIDQFNAKTSDSKDIKYMEGEYLPDTFFQETSGYSNEPEGGKRCTICFKQRLVETAQVAKQNEFELFGTTLTVSPHKNYPLISRIGKEIAEKVNVDFLDMDFKKKDGFKRSIELSKQYGLYRQNYCGCEYSKR